MKSMRALFVVSGIVGALGWAGAASADPVKAAPAAPDKKSDAAPEAPSKVSVGGDVAFVPLLGDLSNAAGPGFGALAAGGYRPLPPLEITARVGYVHHLSRDHGGGSTGIAEIPVLFGARYHFFQGKNGPYAGAELGPDYVIGRASTGAFGGGTASDSELKVGATLGAGYLYRGFDARAQAFVLDLGHAGDSLALMVNVGYRFDLM